MRCLDPILVTDKQGYVKRAPCGQCINCRLNYARQWSIRIAHEQLKYGDNSCFLTLTYAPEQLPDDRSVHKSVLSLFIKRLRKQLGLKRIRYFGCGEYGKKSGLCHYHVIIFGLPVDASIFKNRHDHYEKDDFGRSVKKGWHADLPCWKYGKVHIGTVTPQSANYVAGYALKKVQGKAQHEYYKKHGLEPPFVLMSRRPGIGFDYVNKHKEYYRVNRFVSLNSVKYPLPRYYLNTVGKVYMTVSELSDFLRRRKVSEDKISHYVKMIKRGLDPFYTVESAEQEYKNVMSKLKLKGDKRV